MIKWITKSTTEYRLETKSDVDTFEEELRKDAADKGYQLSSYSWTEKFVKAQGEIIDSYFLVKAVSVVNNPKEPEIPLTIKFDSLANVYTEEQEDF